MLRESRQLGISFKWNSPIQESIVRTRNRVINVGGTIRDAELER